MVTPSGSAVVADMWELSPSWALVGMGGLNKKIPVGTRAMRRLPLSLSPKLFIVFSTDKKCKGAGDFYLVHLRG